MPESNPQGFIVLNRLDKTGIICSGACAVHCLILPLLAYASPTLTSFTQNEWIHKGLLIALLPIAFIAFSKSYKVHKRKSPTLVGGLGVLILISAVLIESVGIEVPYMEKILTAFGSVLLITGHILNTKFLRR
ncbi:MAG: MerC domain-containing protein [Bdellovibrionota bacterium]|nr:MerC domain-containing protein [Bdellovibrionota bacterium]